MSPCGGRRVDRTGALAAGSNEQAETAEPDADYKEGPDIGQSATAYGEPRPDGNEVDDAERPSRREQQAAETLDKYREWYDEALAIKADRSLPQPLQAVDIRRKIASKFGVDSESVKRRLNQHYPGWADYKQAEKK